MCIRESYIYVSVRARERACVLPENNNYFPFECKHIVSSDAVSSNYCLQHQRHLCKTCKIIAYVLYMYCTLIRFIFTV